jgi:intein-encoded DNA endonuclease-like protein
VTESDPQLSELNNFERKEEVQVVSEGKKRGKCLPRELRMRAYNDVCKLRKRGLPYTEIRDEIHRKYGIWISKQTISEWLRGEHNPYNGIRIPSLELLKPSPELAYVTGAVLGDGSTRKRVGRNSYNFDFFIRLKAKDKEFVEDFGRRLGNVLGRRPIRPKFKEVVGKYYVEAASKTLYELLRKPIDLKRIKKYVEHCKKCIAAFLRGLFDSEGCVSEKGYISLYNSNYEVLVYAQRLLRRFGIESTGPWPHIQKGTTMHDPRTGKLYKTKKDCYCIYIRAESLLKFYRHIGFSIRRKQKRLEEYLRRVLSSWYYLPSSYPTRLCTIATAVAISSMLFNVFEFTLL